MKINKGRLNHTFFDYLSDYFDYFDNHTLTMLLNNPINTFLINPNIFYIMIFSLHIYGYLKYRYYQ